MSFVRRLVLPAAAAGVLALGLAPAVPAFASSVTARTASVAIVRPDVAIPADCTEHSTVQEEVYLTCTARPAGQVWEFGAACLIKAGVYNLKFGNEVTGDGKSTIAFCAGATNFQFVVLS